MAIVLYHRHNPVPIFEVLGVSDDGRTMETRPLWGDEEYRRTTRFTTDKADIKRCGYYPVEIDDAKLT